jgi:probable HAF family extracellular repeat protein
VLTGINDAGQIVGHYADAAGTGHGFIYQNGVYFPPLNDPEASGASSASGIGAEGINNAGQIVGSYYNAGAHGFVADAGIDLASIAFDDNTTLAYTANQNNTGGTLAVSDGVHDAAIILLGQYAAADFHAASDFHGGTLVTDPTLTGTSLTAFLASSHT